MLTTKQRKELRTTPKPSAIQNVHNFLPTTPNTTVSLNSALSSRHLDLYHTLSFRTMSKREIEAAASLTSLDDDDYEVQRSRKRSKISDTTSAPLLLKRRSSFISTTFNKCNSNTAVDKVVSVTVSDSTQQLDSIDSREQWEQRSGVEEESQEMRDMTETMRDMVSLRGYARTP